MNKRGFLFTFVSIFLIFSLLILSYNYLQRNKETQKTIAEMAYSSRLSYIRENIVSDYFELLDIELGEINRTGADVIVVFDNFSIISDASQYQTRLDMLEQFIEDEYSNMSNLDITLENFVPEFELYPYNLTFQVYDQQKSEELFIYVGDYDKLNSIDITIQVNQSQALFLTDSFPIDDPSGDMTLHLTVVDPSGNLIHESTTSLDSESENAQYKLQFDKIVSSFVLPTWRINTMQNLTLSYGSFTKQNLYGIDPTTKGTFYLKATGIEANIERFELNLTSPVNDKVILRTKAKMYAE